MTKVVNKCRMIKDAAEELNINYNTAKTIMRTVKMENRIFKRKKVSKKHLKVKDTNQEKVDLCLGGKVVKMVLDKVLFN